MFIRHSKQWISHRQFQFNANSQNNSTDPARNLVVKDIHP